MKEVKFKELTYSYEQQNDKHLLYYSDDSMWSNPNEIAREFIETGNGYKFKQRKKHCLDYDEAAELYLILKELYDNRCKR